MTKNMKKVKRLNTILLVVTCFVALFGEANALGVAKRNKHDASEVDVEAVSIESSSEVKGYRTEYAVCLDFEIENNTSVDIYYLEIRTIVYDEDDRKLGTLTSRIGTEYQSTTTLELEAGEEVTWSCSFTSNSPDGDELFSAMYNSDFEDLTYESRVTYAKFTDDERWQAEDRYK